MKEHNKPNHPQKPHYPQKPNPCGPSKPQNKPGCGC